MVFPSDNIIHFKRQIWSLSYQGFELFWGIRRVGILVILWSFHHLIKHFVNDL